ncbi:transcription factor bHLH144 [Momordica charantia]|uniref:Transcription factor bHLH144 n=1 Tax=Momordica charantia TaxID=3673 RepID=A0A6J1CMS2_MOMCH|nr:transcription factor bHLH144 [Momordica charantia]XP_022142229.1 transcription factor bHLH144 [Momordica charantia]
MDFMQSDLKFYLKKAMLPTANQGDDNHMQIPLSSAFPSVLPPGRKNLGPFNAVELQPSEICPQNFIIFDHTDNRSQIMFHPAIANKLSGPTANMCSKYIQNNLCVNDEHYEDRDISSPLMDDLDGIDALLSLEDEDLDESEDEEISTARSNLNYGNRSPDSSSSSTYSSKPRRKNQTFNPIQKSLSSSRGSICDSDMKQLKVKKMVRKLREILPGGYQMTTVTVLDEAVKYLKSLKDEVQKLGVGGLEN